MFSSFYLYICYILFFKFFWFLRGDISASLISQDTTINQLLTAILFIVFSYCQCAYNWLL